jgi:hypothetical protein
MTEQERIEAKLRLQSQFNNGVSWFYWIAGLSLINSVVILFNGSWSFIAGLGVTQIIDAIAYELAGYFSQNLIYIAFIINLLIIALYVVLGIFAYKRKKWVIICGMVLYSIDTLVFLITKDIVSILFHVYAVYSIFRALKALKLLSELENAVIEVSPQAELAADELSEQSSLPENNNNSVGV